MMGKKRKKQQSHSKPRRRLSRQQTTVRKLLAQVNKQPENVAARLELAGYYLQHDMESQILEALDNLEQQYPFPDTTQNRLYNLLKAYGHAHRKQFIEAEDTVRRLLALDEESLDGHYLLAYIHLSLRELQPAFDECRRYVSLYEKKHESPTLDYAVTPAHLSQVYNFMGSIQQDFGNIETARQFFEMAIASDKRNNLPYINLASLLERLDDIDRAREVVARGMQNCSQVQELRLLAESLQRDATVSVCMIVKNEEELLPGCLDSIRDWVSEIIIVDTGSSDKTVEIAKSYGAKIFHQEWEGNFSKHRNYSLEQATGDWVFIIDADERINLDDIPKIRRLINRQDYRVLAVNVFNYSGKYQEKVTSLASVRFFRRELQLRYKGIVHNQLDIPPSEPVLRTDIRIEHLGYGLSKERMAEKAQRTITLLEKQISEEPDNAFAYFNYAQVLLGMDFSEYPENPEKIIQAASRAVELTRFDTDNRSEKDIHLMSMQQLALTHFIMNNLDTAEELGLCLLEYKPDYLDTLLLMGNIYLRKDDIEQAERYYRKYLETQVMYDKTTGVDEILLLHPRSFHHVNYGLGIVAEHRQDWEKAIQYYEETIRHSPEFLDVNARLGHVYLRTRELSKAEQYFKKQLAMGTSTHLALLGQACISYIQENTEEGDRYIDTLLSIVPTDQPVLLEYARVLYEFEAQEQAIRLLNIFADSDNADEKQRNRLAEMFYQYGEFAKAVQLFERIIESTGTTPELLNDVGGCYFQMGNYEKAEQYYREALHQEKPLPVTYRNLGMTLLKQEKMLEATDIFEKYLETTPNQPEISVLLGDIYFQAENYISAIGHYETYLKEQPGNIGILFKLSECYLFMGHKDSAILGYRQILDMKSDFQPAVERLEELSHPVEQV